MAAEVYLQYTFFILQPRNKNVLWKSIKEVYSFYTSVKEYKRSTISIIYATYTLVILLLKKYICSILQLYFTAQKYKSSILSVYLKYTSRREILVRADSSEFLCKVLFRFGRSRSHIGKGILRKHRKINWLPVSNRVNQCLAVTAYNFRNNNSPKYMNHIYFLKISTAFNTHRSADSFVEPLIITKKKFRGNLYRT